MTQASLRRSEVDGDECFARDGGLCVITKCTEPHRFAARYVCRCQPRRMLVCSKHRDEAVGWGDAYCNVCDLFARLEL